MVETWELRARFAATLARMYGEEVPAYNTLVDVTLQVNRNFAAAHPDSAERLGTLARVSAERHGAIRLGTLDELRDVAIVFGGFGMFPVGYYDLRLTDSPIPVVSTAFRPTDPAELARNPFRVFTSVLTISDSRFFDTDLERRITAFLRRRTLFSPELLQWARQSSREGGLPEPEATHFVDAATSAFRLGTDPIDAAWYRELAAISPVAADIAGQGSTHVNHLTPRVLDIDELYRRMTERGITMIDRIQGPPRWSGPPLLLRQTSFRALAEDRRFRRPDGSITTEPVRVRFGEVEARGIALTRSGREIYDRLIARPEDAHWDSEFPHSEDGLDAAGLAYFTYRNEGSTLVRDPIVYEDFLPASAAGIFASNLDSVTGFVSDAPGAEYGQDRLEGAIDHTIEDPFELYHAQQEASRAALSPAYNHSRPQQLPPTTTEDSPVNLPDSSSLADRAESALAACGVEWPAGDLSAHTPITGTQLRTVRQHSAREVDDAVDAAHRAFLTWRTVPAPARGAVVRRLGSLLTEHKEDLAEIVTLEAGKVTSEALGEVQEMIDICEFAVGLSRQLYGRTMPSERPGHRLTETWHPLGVVGVISAFNFPVAVWSWNTAIALVCGDAVVWKPSETTPLTALACDALLRRALADCDAPIDVHQLIIGGRDVGEALVDNPLVALVSATGSVRMGRAVAPRVAERFGRSLLELGGNNAAVVTPSADLELAVRGIVFSAAGTAGQRCTSLRRLIVHESIADHVVERVAAAYAQLEVGSPFDSGVLVGPLINEAAFEAMQKSLSAARADGGTVVCGGDRVGESGFYVTPALVRMPAQTEVVRAETFAPILYVLTYTDFDDAITLHNGVPQGLSSSIFTLDQREAERFLAADGSDCGIANVNIGTSGAEIGGAFGGEKETGGGRESGSDSWKAYMRRATNTVNYSDQLPLAQGVEFG